MSATDSEHEQAGERNVSKWDDYPSLRKDEEVWAILPAMGNHSLELLQTPHQGLQSAQNLL